MPCAFSRVARWQSGGRRAFRLQSTQISAQLAAVFAAVLGMCYTVSSTDGAYARSRRGGSDNS
eukprot:2590267-Rhodomonas_salina.1